MMWCVNFNAIELSRGEVVLFAVSSAYYVSQLNLSHFRTELRDIVGCVIHIHYNIICVIIYHITPTSSMDGLRCTFDLLLMSLNVF